MVGMLALPMRLALLPVRLLVLMALPPVRLLALLPERLLAWLPVRLLRPMRLLPPHLKRIPPAAQSL